MTGELPSYPTPPASMSPIRPGSDARDPLWLAFYLIGLLLLVTPIFDLVSSAWPVRPGELQWRYGFLGLMGNNLVLPLVGAGILALTAASLGHLFVLRLVAWISIGSALLLLVLAGLFVTDVLQLDAQVNPGAVGGFRAGAAIAAGKYAAGCLALVVLGVGGLRTARSLGDGPGRGGAREPAVSPESDEGRPRVVGG